MEIHLQQSFSEWASLLHGVGQDGFRDDRVGVEDRNVLVLSRSLAVVFLIISKTL
jgi:hypothetical protein